MSKAISLFQMVLFSTILLISTPGIILANGKEHHHADEVMSDHMQSMQALKESIPDEYKIMQRTPILPDEESLQRGGKLFSVNCSVCHGEKGDGTGPAAAGLETAPANFLAKEHSEFYGPGEKFWIIGHGTGETGMPAAQHIKPIDRWHLVNFIYHLQQGNVADPKEQSDHQH